MLVEHRLKLLEINHTVFRLVVFLDQSFNITHRHILSQLLEGILHLLRCDLICAIDIEHRENTSKLLLIEESSSVDCGSQKFRVIDLPVSCVVDLIDHRINLVFCQIQLLLLNVSLDLGCVYQASSIQVENLKLLCQLM